MNARVPGALLLVCILMLLQACKPVHIVLPNRTDEIKQWEYVGETGPEHWGDIDPSFAACANGNEQSPIAIKAESVQTNEKLMKIAVYYQKAEVGLINNGHTIQINLKKDQNTYTIDGSVYRLKQIHFHSPSEHEFERDAFPMEMHLVHQNETGKLAVIGVMIREGAEHNELQKIWRVMPPVKTDQDVDIASEIDLKQLLPEQLKSYRYHGSLTTPPCTEGVFWTVLANPIEMSKKQIDQFRAIFPDNRRPLQPLNGRQPETEVVKEGDNAAASTSADGNDEVQSADGTTNREESSADTTP